MLWEMDVGPLKLILKRLVKTGHLCVIDAKGRSHHFGIPGNRQPIIMRLHDRALPWKMSLRPDLATAEAYMNGKLTIENGEIHDLLDTLLKDAPRSGPIDWLMPLQKLWPALTQWNPRHKARANVAHHYDLSSDLYEIFLDPDMQYSCGYFERRNASLEEAQQAKMQHIAAKLHLHDGPLSRPMKILDIGCGWGGLAVALHRHVRAKVHGITLSLEQQAAASHRARIESAAQDLRFELMDYRDVDGRFDRIVSVGMFEHVGRPHYATFFNKIESLLAEDGVALIHTIGRAHGPGVTDAFTRKYIFPGGYVPALSEILPAIERSGLIVADIEMLRLHYAFTLEHWYARCHAARDRIVKLYDDRFWRMWCFYLAGAICSFRYSGLEIFQIQLARRMDSLPLTRNYIYQKNAESFQHIAV